MKFKEMISSVDDYSNELKILEGKGIKPDFVNCKIYKNCRNNNIISEATFSNLVNRIKSDTTWSILSANRKEFTKEQNILRNRILRGKLDNNKMGVYQLVGHWQECQLQDIDYKLCPKDKLFDVIERSYFVVKPSTMTDDDFMKYIQSLLTIDGVSQDSALIGQNGQILGLNTSGTMYKIGDKVTLNKIAQAYSQFVKKMNIPFVFEGVEIPSSISGIRLFKQENLLY